MKKITFMLIALLAAVVTFAAWSDKQPASPFEYLSKSEIVKKQQPTFKGKALDRKAQPKRNGVRKAPAELVTPPADATPVTYYTTGGNFYVSTSSGWSDVTSYMPTVQVAVVGTNMYIQGLAYWFKEAWIKGTIDGTTVTFLSGQYIGSDEYGDEFVVGSEDGETVADIVFEYDSEAGTLTATTAYILESGVADEPNAYCYWVQPVFSLTEPEVVVPEVVEAPEGLETEEYIIKARNYKDDADVNVSVLVGFDGSDVYIQGLCTYIPEAWAKGTLDGATVTFATGQYFGTYANTYDMYLNVLMGEDVVFDYDAEAGTFTAQNEFFLVDNDSYYFDSYRGAVIKKVVEKAAMPANPAITALTNGSYGWYITFNVPNVDTEGDGLASSKLSYMIYTDTEGEIAPLTFTPDTHTYLTEDMTEIPYGFTEDWDFYDTQIYLNELYSADWNNLGIQSIYYGGGETNATEIQWYHIKDYAVTTATFNFNEMEVATSATGVTDGDITEDKAITEGEVTLTISPKTTSSTENRFWSTSAGPQLRVYSGTLTFSVPDGYGITEIKFNHNGRWGANTIDEVEIPNDADNKVATWTLAEDAEPATEIVVAIAANSQINSIDVTVAKVPDQLVELPEGVEAEAWALEGFYSDGESGMDILQSTEVAIVGNDIYVKGLPYYFEDAWLKGTIEDGIATFPAGQFVGEDDYGKEYMNGYDEADEDAEEYDICDIQYYYDAEAKTLTQATLYVLECGTKSGYDEDGELSVWGWWEVSNLHAGDPIEKVAVEVPEDLVTEDYLFSANEYVEVEDDEDAESARRMKTPRKALTLEPYKFQIQVGFDGQDVYFKGFTENTADMWAKGTLSEDGKTVTIPANQYIGTIESLFSSFDFHLAAIDEYYEPADIVLNYDAEAGKFSTEQTVATNGSMFVMYTYQSFGDVEITKIPEVAATPADPSIDDYKLTGTSYPYVCFNIPAEDIDGNAILASKLFYTVWVEVDGIEQPFDVLADEYSYIEEDITEVPYTYDDNYDIYRGGSRFYFNPADAVPTWTKIGVQSIYYGGGECNKSNIVWMENPAYDPTTVGITNINADNQKVVIFDLQGRRVAAPAKGLYIVNGKKVVIK